MSDTQSIYWTELDPAVEDSHPIRTLMKECGCTRQRAIDLLNICNNDVDAAKKHHDLYQVYAQDPPEDLVTPFNGHGALSVRSLSSSQANTPSSDQNIPLLKLLNAAELPTKGAPDNSSHKEWNFILPKLVLDAISLDQVDYFDSYSLASAVQHGAIASHIRSYLNLCDTGVTEQNMNTIVEGFPLIFYAVASNNEDIVRLFIEYGANPNAVFKPLNIPLLAFAIICSETLQIDTTNMVCVLLSKGASPWAIPKDLYTPYLHDNENSAGQQDSEVTEEVAWCSPEIKARLSKNVNLTHRYFLEKSTKLKPPSTKRRQIARLRNCQGLLGIPYFLVGQSVATELLIQRLLIHMMLPAKKPLVLCFAGPSGHGKTELARQLGHLLSLNLEVVDCTTFTHEMELFGPRRPYHGYEMGSAVNNFLVRHSGKRCIVFLDEFEKTTKEIHSSLLLPFDNGEYQDRRNGDKINCSKTIWILATNALDNTILDFCEDNDAITGDDGDEKSRQVRKLSQQLRESFLQQFGAPVTGRISDFIPLLPFSVGEQAVITHKCLLGLAQDLRLPICLIKGPSERLIGNIRLLIRRDGTVCSTLAKSHYHVKLGARSLMAGAEKVKRIVLDVYLDDDEEITEQDGLRDFIIDVDNGDIVGKTLTDTRANTHP
ncbi:P-loop containing nucleoside triphosphate hydrolase protein [Trichoderma sp. SZMC 28014]